MKIMHNGIFQEESCHKFDWDSMAIEDGFFTTTRYDRGEFFQWDAHIRRLEDSLEKHGINFPRINLKQQCLALLKENNLLKARIKIVVYRKDKTVNYTILMKKLEIDKTTRRLKLKLKENADQDRFKYKTANYSFNIIHNKLAHQQGYDDFLFYDEKNRILETTFCNILFRKGDKIVTPCLDLPILPGVYRKYVIDSWRKEGMEVIEREIFLNELESFSKCYVTNSIHGLVEAEIV